MPRIANALIRKARTIDSLLPALLRPCRDSHAAQNELRWLREHVDDVVKTRRVHGKFLAKGALLQQLVKERSSGKPIQFILGTEFFGDLEIKCRPGVLIPRQDTAASVLHITKLLGNAPDLPPVLQLLDLCTGTGCIPLLFQHELHSAPRETKVQALGVDVSKKALSLARLNAQRIRRNYGHHSKAEVQFMRADILLDSSTVGHKGPLPLLTALERRGHSRSWDILISNPPYISPSHYWKTTTRSVRGFEPKLALVPPPNPKCNDIQQGDMFYPRLLNIAKDVDAKIVLFEVADLEQAVRVALSAQNLDFFDGVEIWRDDPGAIGSGQPQQHDGINIVGDGNARSVLCYRGAGISWLSKG